MYVIHTKNTVERVICIPTASILLGIQMNDVDAEEESERISEMPSAIAAPLQSIDVINNIVSLLFTYRRSVMYKDMVAAAKLHPATISQGLSASRDLGLTKSAGKKGLYVLTKEGEEYGRLITAGKENDAKPYLKSIIMRNQLWTEILLFLKATRGQARDPLDLVLDIERKLGKKWAPGMRNRLRAAYVSILSYVGLIQKEGDKMISVMAPEILATVASQEPEKTAGSQALPISTDFARLETNDFKFEIRKDVDVIDFAKNQFLAWIDYEKKKLITEQTQEKDEPAK
jgi:hypothetical protein